MFHFHYDLFLKSLDFLEENLMKLRFSDHIREEWVPPGDHLNKDCPGIKMFQVYFCYTHFPTVFRSKTLEAINQLLSLMHWGKFNDTGHLLHWPLLMQVPKQLGRVPGSGRQSINTCYQSNSYTVYLENKPEKVLRSFQEKKKKRSGKRRTYPLYTKNVLHI